MKMAVYKDEKTNTWMVYYRVTDWKGDRKQSTKENTWESKSKAVSFRVSEEEAKFINDCVALSGLTKQDYREHHRKNGIEAR